MAKIHHHNAHVKAIELNDRKIPKVWTTRRSSLKTDQRRKKKVISLPKTEICEKDQ